MANVKCAETEQVITNNSGAVLVPPTPQVYSHDGNGNLLSDGLWVRTWNAENRMTRVESAASVPAQARKREDWTYLPDGRWIERIVSTNNGSAYYPAFTNRYVWDGKVLLAVLDHTNGLVMSFMRGMDLSGSIEGAGGVGGVLAVNFYGSEPSMHFLSYDGNGNVIALTDAFTAETTTVFEYGPFGELLRSTGPMADQMPLRFSTMYADDVTGDVKYLFRDLTTPEGRWTSRDPIEERGGLNLFGFVGNQPISKYDVLGFWWFCNNCKPNQVRILRTDWLLTPQGWSPSQAQQWRDSVSAFQDMQTAANILALAEGNPSILFPSPDVSDNKVFNDVLAFRPVTAWAYIKYEVCVNKGKRFWFFGSDQWDWQLVYYPSFGEWAKKDYETGVDARDDASDWIRTMYIAIKEQYPDENQ